MNGAMDIMKTDNILGINKVRHFLYKVPETGDYRVPTEIQKHNSMIFPGFPMISNVISMTI